MSHYYHHSDCNRYHIRLVLISNNHATNSITIIFLYLYYTLPSRDIVTSTRGIGPLRRPYPIEHENLPAIFIPLLKIVPTYPRVKMNDAIMLSLKSYKLMIVYSPFRKFFCRNHVTIPLDVTVSGIDVGVTFFLPLTAAWYRGAHEQTFANKKCSLIIFCIFSQL